MIRRAALFFALVALAASACSEEEARQPQQPGPSEDQAAEAGETEAEATEADDEDEAGERVPRMQISRMATALGERCLGRTDSHERACVSDEVCQSYCDRMIPESHTSFMAFPCGVQHDEVCYEATRPAAGSPAFAAAEDAGEDEPGEKCWRITAQATGKSVLACGNLGLKIYWVGE